MKNISANLATWNAVIQSFPRLPTLLRCLGFIYIICRKLSRGTKTINNTISRRCYLKVELQLGITSRIMCSTISSFYPHAPRHGLHRRQHGFADGAATKDQFIEGGIRDDGVAYHRARLLAQGSITTGLVAGVETDDFSITFDGLVAILTLRDGNCDHRSHETGGVEQSRVLMLAFTGLECQHRVTIGLNRCPILPLQRDVLPGEHFDIS